MIDHYKWNNDHPFTIPIFCFSCSHTSWKVYLYLRPTILHFPLLFKQTSLLFLLTSPLKLPCERTKNFAFNTFINIILSSSYSTCQQRLIHFLPLKSFGYILCFSWVKHNTQYYTGKYLTTGFLGEKNSPTCSVSWFSYFKFFYHKLFKAANMTLLNKETHADALAHYLICELASSGTEYSNCK